MTRGGGSSSSSESSAPGGEAALTRDDVLREIDALVDECRAESLWYLRRDYYPRTDVERLQILDAIQEHTHVDAFRRAGRLKEWLSRHSSAASARS